MRKNRKRLLISKAIQLCLSQVIERQGGVCFVCLSAERPSDVSNEWNRYHHLSQAHRQFKQWNLIGLRKVGFQSIWTDSNLIFPMDSNGETQEKNWFTVTLKSSLRLLSYRYCWCYRGFLGFLSQGMQLKLKQETLLQQSNNCPTAKSSLKVRSEQRHLFYIYSDWLAWKSIYLSGFRYLLWRGGQFREREEGKHSIGWQRSNIAAANSSVFTSLAVPRGCWYNQPWSTAYRLFKSTLF